VNKVDSRVEIIFNISESKSLSPYQKHIIFTQSDIKLNNDCICIVVQERRTQYENRRLALSRLTKTLQSF